jgi:HAD superfamily hydrolase (TIGR01509 family)
MPFDLVILDCDGVLIDSEIIACAVDAEMLTAAGYAISTAEIVSRFAGVPGAAMLAQIEAEMGRSLPVTLAGDIDRRVLELYRTDLQAMPGISGALERLGRPYCVASSSAPTKLALGLIEVGLYDLFYPNIFSARLVNRGKPAPDLFLHAAAAMDVVPSRCLVVEDSVAGVQAARAAGMTVVGFTGGSHCALGHADRLEENGVAFVVRSFAELEERLGSVISG